jgi:hypothetical protein
VKSWQTGRIPQHLNSLSAWVRVTLMGSEEMVVVQGQVIDIDDLGIASHQETHSGGAEHVFYPWSRVFSVAPLPAQHAS